jgi:hypothetical protein
VVVCAVASCVEQRICGSQLQAQQRSEAVITTGPIASADDPVRSVGILLVAGTMPDSVWTVAVAHASVNNSQSGVNIVV